MFSPEWAFLPSALRTGALGHRWAVAIEGEGLLVLSQDIPVTPPAVI